MNTGFYPGPNGLLLPESLLSASGLITSPVNSGVNFSGDISISGGSGLAYSLSLTGTPPAELSYSLLRIARGLWIARPTGKASTIATTNFGVKIVSGVQSFNVPQTLTVNSSTQGWNPSDKGSSITLSNGNFTITSTSSGTWNTVRSVTSHADGTGKYYFEVSNDADPGGVDLVAGVADSTVPTSNYMSGSGGNCAALQDQGTNRTNGFTGVTGGGSWGPGKFLMVAVDMTARKGWMQISGVGSWANGGNPDTGTSPSFTWSSAYTLFAAASIIGTSTQLTLNTGSNTFTNTPPSTFTAWG